MTKVFLPANPLVPIVTNTFDSLGRVATQTDPDIGVYTYYFSGRRSEEVDPLGNKRVMYYSSLGSLEKDFDAAGELTEYFRDGLNRLVKTVYPEGNSVELTYDTSNNVVTKTYKAKPGSLLADVVQNFTYDPAWNKVATIEDGRGLTTSYDYDSTQGTLLSITRPMIGSETPVYSFTYNSRGQLLTRFEPVAGTSGIVDSFEYDTATERLLSSTADFGTGRLNLQTTFEHDNVGNIVSVTDPRGNTTVFEFDDERRLVQREEAAPFGFITENEFDENGWLTAVRRQTSDPANPWQVTSFAYSPVGKLLTVTDPMNREFSFGYDELGRLITKTDAESRVWQFAYDEISRVSTVTDPMLDLAERRTYTANGRLATTTDANDNVTSFEWDGFDRLYKRVYPDTTFEQFSYDENSNVLTQITRKGDTITSVYDSLNRLLTRDPATLPLQTFSYDLSGRPTKISTPVTSGDPTSGDYQFFYDTAGRLLQQRTPSAQNVTYELDENGNRTKLTWPDSYFAEYSVDSLNRTTSIKLNGSTTNAVEFGYDALSRRVSLAYENGSSTAYSYWPNDDLSAIVHSFVASSLSLSYAYNNVHQVLGLSVSDDALLWSPETTKATTYDTANNLNEYPAVDAMAFSYDDNGCLISDSVKTCTFDELNRLLSASKTGVSVSYLNDPMNRQARKEVTVSSTIYTEDNLFDGNMLIAQFDAGGSLLNRYLYAPSGEVVAQMASGGTITFIHHDRLASVIATSNASGAVANKFSYSPAGETPSLAGIPFGFTGQKYDSEIGLYNYKTRYYDPSIGRFLQPDPLGYDAGDMNLYAYVDNDLVNRVDPLGLSASSGFFPRPSGPSPTAGTSTGNPTLGNNGSCLGPQGPQPGAPGPQGGNGPVRPGPGPIGSPPGTPTEGPGSQVLNAPPPPERIPGAQGPYTPIDPATGKQTGPTVYPGGGNGQQPPDPSQGNPQGTDAGPPPERIGSQDQTRRRVGGEPPRVLPLKGFNQSGWGPLPPNMDFFSNDN